MKKKLNLFLVLILLNFPLANSLSSEEIKTSFGIWDWKHFSGGGTGAYALNLDYEPNEQKKNINLPIIGSVKKIYSLTIYADINNSFEGGINSLTRNTPRAELGGFISVGLEKDFKLFNKLTLSPSFAPSLYGSLKDGKSMGYPLEFKSQIKIKYDLLNNSSISLYYNHLSNANIGSWNPGSDTILFSFRISEVF